MNMRLPEPLTPEERELAARIARLGPHGEPSPALDAKILAAAHSTVAGTPRKRRPRWPLYAGVAASALLAVGIAWQLRPMHEAAAPAASDAPAANETRVAQIVVAPAESASPPPPLKAVPPPEVVPPAPRRAVATPAPEPPAAAPLAEPAPMADTAAGIESVAPAEPVFAPEPPVAAQRATSGREVEAYKAEANAERRQRTASALSSRELAPPAPAPAPAPPPPPAPAAEAAAADSTSLDQVVVAGTRIDALADVPAEEDAKLSKRKWLKRIEQRLEQDDIDGARASLRLFVGKYPQAELPPELRELLEE